MQHKLNYTAMLGAMSLLLATIEYALPKPLPFIKIGLSNMPLLLALILPLKNYIALIAIKVLGQAIFSGTLFSPFFLISAPAGIISALLMYSLHKIFSPQRLSFAGISTLGAFSFNCVQLVFVRFFILGSGAYIIAVPLLIMGIASGFILGIICGQFAVKSQWYNQNCVQFKSSEYAKNNLNNKQANRMVSIKTIFVFILCLVVSLIMFFSSSLNIKIFFFIAAFCFAVLRGKCGNPLYTIIFFIGIVFCNLISPYGKELYIFGNFVITQGALENGIAKACVIETLMLVSKSMIDASFELPGRFGALLGKSIYIYVQLNACKKQFHPSKWVDSLDAMFLKIHH